MLPFTHFAIRPKIGAITAVFGGMIAATFLSLAIVPMLYYVVQTLTEKLGRSSKGS